MVPGPLGDILKQGRVRAFFGVVDANDILQKTMVSTTTQGFLKAKTGLSKKATNHCNSFKAGF